jgi:hypothetical protein
MPRHPQPRKTNIMTLTTAGTYVAEIGGVGSVEVSFAEVTR